MGTRKNTFLLKRSNVAGKIPSAGDLLLGELALNTADNILYASGTTANSILPIGWDRIARTGDTMTGTLYVPTISATTYENLPSEFVCNTLSACTVIQDIDLEISGLTSQVNELSATTQSIQENYVPYIGATQELDLGYNNFRNNNGLITTWENGGATFGYEYIGNTKQIYFYDTSNDFGYSGQSIDFTCNLEQGCGITNYGYDFNDGTYFGSSISNTIDAAGFNTQMGNNNISQVKTFTGEVSLTNITDGAGPLMESSIKLWKDYTQLTITNNDTTEANTIEMYTDRTYTKKYITTDEGYVGDYLQLNTAATEPVEAGKIVWNAADGTFDMGLLNSVTLQAGQEIHLYAKASEDISNGDAIQFAGSQGDHLLIKKAVPSEITANPEYFIGIATQDFATNDFGYVTVFGQVRDLDTTMYSGGTVLYYQSSGTTNGLLTDVRPTGPRAKIIVAAVVRSHQNQGSLFVRPHVMPMIGDLQNVEINNAQSAEVLTYDSDNEVWVNKVLPSSIDGSGTVNYVPKFTASETLGNSQIYDDGTNVGIGTTSPSAKFQVESSDSTTRIRIKNNNASLNAGIEIRDLNNLFKGGFLGSSTNMGFYGPGGNFPGIELSNNDAIAFRKQSDGQTNMYLSPTGLLGIGTTSPSAKIHLVDTALAGSGALSGSVLNLEQTWNTTGTPTAIKLNVTNTASNSNSSLMDLQVSGITQFRVRGDNVVGNVYARNGISLNSSGFLTMISRNSVSTAVDVNGTALSFGDASNNVAGYSYFFRSTQYAGRTFASGVGGYVIIQRDFVPTSGNGIFNILTLENTINQTGGANGITRGLYINPTLTSAADWRSIELTNNTGFGIYQSGTANNSFAGNVGIGTTTPSYKLDVLGQVRIGTTTAVPHLIFNRSGNNYITTPTGGSLLVNLSNSANESGAIVGMYSTGLRVGTGISNPSATLHIRGAGSTDATTSLRVDNSSGTTSMVVLGNGNVGIGTTVPSATLDVQGDILIKSANISNQENLDVDTGTEVVATVAIADYDAAFFDFVIKNGTNLRAGTVYAVHDGTNVEYTETSTSDLGNTSDVTLSVDISSGNMRLLATTTTDNWIIKSLVRAI